MSPGLAGRRGLLSRTRQRRRQPSSFRRAHGYRPARRPWPGDLAEFLDVDVNELAGTLALVALNGLQAEPAEAPHPDPGQDSRDRRERHPERLGDLGTAQAQTAQRRDRLDTLLVGAVGDPVRRRGAIQQAALALSPVPPANQRQGPVS